MVKYPFFQVDAFTENPLEGNPCAVVLDADDLSDESMLAIAREMNLSETAFVRHSSTCDFGVRYFTPAEEIPMAGHPTVATTFALVEAGRLKLQEKTTRITLELKVGPIAVEILSDKGSVQSIIMTQKKPQFLRTYSASDVLPVFHLQPDDALADSPIQTVSTGTPQLMIPLKSHESLRRARIDVERYEKLRSEGDFFSPH
jgi:trans-2,3-dihydro-3-hydroxyanthranilate isomerase